MAGDWIKIECSTPDKPEVLRIARICGVDKDIAFSKLVRVWIWFDTVSVDGVVDACVDADIDMLASLSGLANAMRSVGWLDSDSDASGNQINIKMPNFDTHTSESAKKRALKNKRQARWRNNVDADVDASVDDQRDSKASTREEKRREEKKKEKDIGSTFVPPLWVDQQLWDDFIEMRKKIKKPATDRAKQLLVTELLKLVQMGYTQEEIIGNSIKNCWQDFYAPKNSGGSRGFVC